MTAIRVVQLGDPEVEFGDGKSARIKEGLASGPTALNSEPLTHGWSGLG
jgi:hypothetical protein